jgi:predicted nucleic acid-binding protein
MRICIDSNQFIFGIAGTDPAAETLMLLLPHLDVVIPRLVMKEVTRNLTEGQAKALYVLLAKAPRVEVIDEPVPNDLVAKYIKLGLPEKADAFIGAFVECQGAQYLVSDNRHFLMELTGTAFEVLRPEEFLQHYYQIIRGAEGKESND